MEYADIHIHALFGVDDGAKTEAEMCKMVDCAYAAGTRILCLTPHFHPGYFGENQEKVQENFAVLLDYTKKQYPQMELFLGNELRYDSGCISWLKSGACRTMNHTRYVLVDFSERAPGREISQGLDKLLNAGYVPILAHVERYRTFHGKMKSLYAFKENGVVFQIDTQSIFMGFGLRVQRQCRALLSEGIADLISSDAHDCKIRHPDMNKSRQYIENKYGAGYAKALCYENAVKILHSTNERKEVF